MDAAEETEFFFTTRPIRPAEEAVRAVPGEGSDPDDKPATPTWFGRILRGLGLL